MNITYRKNPVLEKLNNEKLGVVMIDEKDKNHLTDYIKDVAFLFNNSVTNFKKEIVIVSDAFAEATGKAKNTLTKIIEKELIDEASLCGTFMLYNSVNCLDFTQNVVCLFMFSKKGVLEGVYRQSEKDTNNDFLYLNTTVAKTHNIKTEDDLYKFFYTVISECMLISTFKKYAQVEEKILPPKKKTKDMYCKYVNDTSLQITHLDSKWFTDIVQSNGFKVRGHFRLQPYKHTKKLIWISDFTKTGYTSKAKVKPLS